MKQVKFLSDHPLAYGGDLLKTRKGRSTPRPLDTIKSIHLVLRSSKAHGTWSFATKENRPKIKNLVAKFSRRYRIKVYSFANVGNHLHLHIKLSSEKFYAPFIRALTGTIATAISQKFRWSMRKGPLRFWDRRPYTSIVTTKKYFFTLRDYIQINKLEGYGLTKRQARFFYEWDQLMMSG